jgi:hypothetical protein
MLQKSKTLPEAQARTRNTRQMALASTFLALLIVVLIPFTLVSPLPLSDYPNHVARMHILAHLSESADLARHYLLHWEFIPNLAMDLLVPMLMPPLSAEQASLAFAALAMFLMASGAIVLHRVLYGHWSLLPFAAFLFLYNRHFLWGFLNYLFSVGLALWMLAAHIHLRNRSDALRVVLFSLLSTALLISHLHAFASYAILVGGYEVSVAWRQRGKQALARSAGGGRAIRPSCRIVPFAVQHHGAGRRDQMVGAGRQAVWPAGHGQ